LGSSIERVDKISFRFENIDYLVWTRREDQAGNWRK